MNKMPIILEEKMELMGKQYQVQVFSREGGTFCALTRFSDVDAIITDGRSISEVLKRHAVSLPLAIDCRISSRKVARRNGI